MFDCKSSAPNKADPSEPPPYLGGVFGTIFPFAVGFVLIVGGFGSVLGFVLALSFAKLLRPTLASKAPVFLNRRIPFPLLPLAGLTIQGPHAASI